MQVVAQVSHTPIALGRSCGDRRIGLLMSTSRLSSHSPAHPACAER